MIHGQTAMFAPTPIVLKKCVLVAEDDDIMRELLTAAVQRGPYRVLSARDGVEALDVARAERPDVVLLDAEMPRMHGFDVCRELKGDPATQRITVLMLTALAQEADRARGMAAGADGYISKPIGPRDLLSRLNRELGVAE